VSRRDIERVTAVSGGGATDVVVVGWDPDVVANVTGNITVSGWDPGVVANVTGNLTVAGWNSNVVANVGGQYSNSVAIGDLPDLPGLPASFFPTSQYIDDLTGLVGTGNVKGYARVSLNVVYLPRIIVPAPTQNQLILGILWSYNGSFFWAETAVSDPTVGTTATTFSGGPTLIKFITTSGLGAPAQTYLLQLSVPAGAEFIRVIAFDGDAAAPGSVTACTMFLGTI